MFDQEAIPLIIYDTVSKRELPVLVLDGVAFGEYDTQQKRLVVCYHDPSKSS